ncbi:NAD-dependent epimerase/dehydratase family protein [Henriciella marina]|uniref:NAD-dependent epimerase/dehydratase family protein n=1 Tax=Henriciella marina TaxID=453851 RepID=UPI001461579C|nr:NAD(P)-dependent oxidoreductase [Henriciella marina]
MRVLITGANGFIGRWLTRRLAADDAVETVAAIRAPNSVQFEGARATRLSDLADRTEVHDVINSVAPDIIINLAAYGVSPDRRDPVAMFNVNAAAPVAIVQAASALGAAVVGVGSQSEYTANNVVEQQIQETDPIGSQALYGASKASAWLGASATARQLNCSYIHLRLFNTYGHGEAAHRLLPTLARAARTGDKAVLSDGLQVRDFVYIEDAVESLVAAAHLANRQRSGLVEAVNVCSGDGTSVRRFAEIAASAFGLPPQQLSFGTIGRRPDDLPYIVGSPEKAFSLLGWTARHSVSEGLAKVAAMQAAPNSESLQ